MNTHRLPGSLEGSSRERRRARRRGAGAGDRRLHAHDVAGRGRHARRQRRSSHVDRRRRRAAGPAAPTCAGRAHRTSPRMPRPDVVADSAPDVHADAHIDRRPDGRVRAASTTASPITPATSCCASRVPAELHLPRRRRRSLHAASLAQSMDPSSVDPVTGRQHHPGRRPTRPEIEVDDRQPRGSAERYVSAGRKPGPTPPPPRSFPPGAPEVTRFLYHLQSGGRPHQARRSGPCPALVPNVRSSVHLPNPRTGVTSGDLRCLINPSDAQTVALVHDVRRAAGDRDDPATIRSTRSRAPPPAARSRTTSAAPAAGNFPDTCAVGACTCSPTIQRDRRHLRLPDRRLLRAVGRLRRAGERLHRRRGSDLQRQPGDQRVPRHTASPAAAARASPDSRWSRQRQVLLTAAQQRRALRACARPCCDRRAGAAVCTGIIVARSQRAGSNACRVSTARG